MAVGGIKDTDFVGFPLKDFGVNVDITPVTKVLTTFGNEELVEGTPTTVLAFLNPKINKYTNEKHGLHKQTDGYLMTDPTEDISKDYIVEYNNMKWRVINVKVRDIPAGGVSVYKFCELHFIDG